MLLHTLHDEMDGEIPITPHNDHSGAQFCFTNATNTR